MSQSDFDFSKLDVGESSSARRSSTPAPKRPGKKTTQPARTRRRNRLPVGLVLTFVLLVLAIVGVVVLMVRDAAENLDHSPTSITRNLSVDEQSPLAFNLRLLIDGDSQLRFAMVSAPTNAKLNDVGVLNWTPSEADGPSDHKIIVNAFAAGSDQASHQITLVVSVAEVNRPPVVAPVLPQTVDPTLGLALRIRANDPDSPGVPLRYSLLNDSVADATIDPQTGEFKWGPTSELPPQECLVQVRVAEAVPNGLETIVEFPIRWLREANPPMSDPATTDEPLNPRVVMDSNMKSDSEGSEALPSLEEADFAAFGEEKIRELYRERELFKPHQYPLLREIYATRFEQEHEDEIRAGLGESADEAVEWFADHKEIQQELYTAIDAESDDVTGAIAMFHRIREQHPEHIVPYAHLAIATAVVWDNEKGVYRYENHQRRTHSRLPESMVDGTGNYEYFLNASRFMPGRGQFLPWEFLVHVVNHTTPIEERRWAIQNYQPKRFEIGKCYGDVPYDHEMLQSQSEICRLDGKDYTLANLRQFGGVCSNQADFAARVAKCLGVPAAAITGQSRFGGGHAWVMWVELQNVTATGIQFQLKSHGRYRGDHYYVGHFKDPQTGSGMTDRQLELRLQAVGMNAPNYRRAKWLMQSFPSIAESEALDVLDRMRYLAQVIEICPLNEGAWRALAQMSRDGLMNQRHEKLMVGNIDSMLSRFAMFPDFTWEVFDDLIAFNELPQRRNLWYSRLIQMYENASRPDLAAAARLKHSDYLVEAGELNEALRGLEFTIMKFPQEGRFVPGMLDRMEQIASQVDGAERELIPFYKRFLPLIEQKRGEAASTYCINMYRRGIQRFQQAGDAQAAAVFQNELAKLESIGIQL